MSIRIALVYLDVMNLGDLVINETARYIVEDILAGKNIKDYEIIPVGISSTRFRGTDLVKAKRKGLIGRAINIGFIYRHFPKFTKRTMMRNFRKTKSYQYYLQNERHKLYDADMIIFGGGGLIKFHRQNFHYFLRLQGRIHTSHNRRCRGNVPRRARFYAP